jgi:hypothetical protein
MTHPDTVKHLRHIANFEPIYKPNGGMPPVSSPIDQSWYYLKDKTGTIHVYLSKKSRDSAKSSRGGKSVRASSRVVRDAKHNGTLVKHF